MYPYIKFISLAKHTVGIEIATPRIIRKVLTLSLPEAAMKLPNLLLHG
jgi:hypothetical protein